MRMLERDDSLYIITKEGSKGQWEAFGAFVYCG